ncbi:UNVERIFIED_CONTAM: Phytanoyl-CoA dioxygenase domain-containing protein 1 [Trichonephila clavipes]
MDYQKLYQQYQENGCIKIENFLNPSEVENMKQGLAEAMKDVPADAHSHSSYSDPKTKEDEQYYINSADKVAYFFEADALDENGKLVVEKDKALNKIAYVRPHQDSTYLYTEPPSCIGLWFPIEEATIENGCLWFLPGSHKRGTIYQRYERNPGDCVLIHGSVLHKSARNNTEKPRVIYTFHATEKENEWSKLNWLQPTAKLPFPSIYSN